MTTRRDTRHRLTESQLADALNRGLGFTVRLLEELEAAGRVERCGPNRWRLTLKTEAKYGSALRGMIGDEEEQAA